MNTTIFVKWTVSMKSNTELVSGYSTRKTSKISLSPLFLTITLYTILIILWLKRRTSRFRWNWNV